MQALLGGPGVIRVPDDVYEIDPEEWRPDVVERGAYGIITRVRPRQDCVFPLPAKMVLKEPLETRGWRSLARELMCHGSLRCRREGGAPPGLVHLIGATEPAVTSSWWRQPPNGDHQHPVTGLLFETWDDNMFDILASICGQMSNHRTFAFEHKGHRIDLAGIIRVVMDAVDGVAFLHRCGFLHGDLSPSNVLIRWPGSPHGTPGATRAVGAVTDLGEAINLEMDTDITYRNNRFRTTTSGEHRAVHYLASDSRASPGYDVFSVGALVACAVAGRPKFHTQDHMAAWLTSATERQNQNIPWGSACQEGVEVLIDLACACIKQQDRPSLSTVRVLLQRAMQRLPRSHR
jgi:hypothetical protein